MIERICAENVDRLIALRNAFCQEDPYIVQRTAEDYLAAYRQKMEQGSLLLRLLIENGNDAGYSLLEAEGQTGWIREIFVVAKQREVMAYTSLIEDALEQFGNMNVNLVRHICPEQPMERTAAFCDFGFDLLREHVQMEMPLMEIYSRKPDLQLKPFYMYSNAGWILEWVEHCAQRTDLYALQEIERLIMKREAFSFVACQENEPVGFMIAEVNEQRNRQERQQVLYVEHMAVAPVSRMQGVATRMLDLVFREALQLGLVTARLHVFHDNDAAYRLYKKLGFVEVKRINHWAFALD